MNTGRRQLLVVCMYGAACVHWHGALCISEGNPPARVARPSGAPLGGERLRLRGGSSEAADDVDAIDFEAALRAARQSQRAGESEETTMAAVESALQNEVPFCPLKTLPQAGGYLAIAWMSEMQAKLAVHEAVTMPGWEVRREGIRALEFNADTSLPPWLTELAQRLRTAFGHPPNACELHALEPGHSLPARTLIEHKSGDPPATVACVSLTGSGLLGLSQGELAPEQGAGQPARLVLQPGSCMLLQGEAARDLQVQVSAEERHILLIFRLQDQHQSQPRS